jgi:cytochrome c-type biogenesis protein CcmH
MMKGMTTGENGSAAMKKMSGHAVRRMALLHVLAMISFLSLTAVAAPVQEDPLDREVLEIAKDLRCTVCQNQPVAESNADLAKDMRQIIREQLVAGKSRDEIVNYFVARYGDYVLMKPPTERAGLLLWIVPPALLVTLALLSWIFLRQRSQAPPPPTPALSEQDQARVRAARGLQEPKKDTKKKSAKKKKDNQS